MTACFPPFTLACAARRWAVSLLCAGVLPGLATSARAEAEPDPRRPAAIVTENIPPTPERLWARLAEYQQVRPATFLGWAPSGKGVLIQTRFGATAQLHRVYQPGGRREQISFYNEAATGKFLHESDSDAILLSMGQGGNENFQIYYFGSRRKDRAMLTDGKSRNVLGPIERHGSRAIVLSNQRNGRDTDILLADARQPGRLETLLETDGEFWTAQDWSLDGARLLLNRYVSATETYPALFEIASRKLTQLPQPTHDKAACGHLAFAPDGRTALVTTDAAGEFMQLARMDLASFQYDWLAPDVTADVSDLAVDEHSGRVAFAVNDDGASALYLLDGQQRRRVDIPLGVASDLEFSPDGAELGFTLARPTAPADVYSVRVSDGQLTRWTFGEAGGLDHAELTTPQRIRFPSFDGRMIPAYCFRPRTASRQEPAPVLLSIHGGPEAQYQPLFSGLIQFYANELGVAVICPNVRGSSGYGKTYLKLDNAQRREDSVKDIGALLDWIGTQEDLDAHRVAVMGGSYGGYMVLASLTHFPERIKAGIDIVGIANFITFLEHTSPYRQDLRRAEYGDERDAAMRAVFERINPSANAEKISSALLVVHGKNDPRVPFSEAEQIAAVVRSKGRPVWTLYAGNEGHGFEKKENRDYEQAAEAMFLIDQLGLKWAQ